MSQQFLYLLRPTRVAMLAEGATAREAEVVAQHFAYLQGLVASGVAFMAGRTLLADERTFGIVVFTAASEPQAREIVAGDPAVREGVMTAELFPYRVALWSARSPLADGDGP